VLARNRKRRIGDGLRVPILQQLRQIRGDALVMLKRLAPGLLTGRGLVLEIDLDALVQVARDLEALADQARVEFGLWKNLRVGRKNTVVPVPRAGPIFFTPPMGSPCLYFCSQV